MAGKEIVKADEGLVAVVKRCGENAVQAAVSAEQLKSAPFVQGALSLTDVLINMASTIVASIEQPSHYGYVAENGSGWHYGSSIYASPKGELKVNAHDFRLRIDTREGTAKLSLSSTWGYGTPKSVFERVEPQFIKGEDRAVYFFREYASLPQRLSEFTEQLRNEAEQRNALVQQAMQAREVPDIIIDVEDPIEERFRLLEGAMVPPEGGC